MCSVMHADGPFEWPPALRHPSERRLRVTFPKDARPDKVTLRSKHSLVGEESTAGPSERVPFKLRPRRKDGEIVGWKVLFRRTVLGHHFIWLYALWEGKHHCTYQEAPYGFHVETVENLEGP